MNNDDQILISRVLANNDQRAYRELVNRYQSPLRYSLRQLCGWDEAVADDLAQETFIKAFTNLGSFRGDASFYTWSYRIAYIQYASYYRSRKPTEPLPDKPDENVSHQPIGNTDLHRDISRALTQLPPDQAMALHLHFQREHTHQEISQIMDCPLGTIKSHIQRGRKKLKVLLCDWQTTVTP